MSELLVDTAYPAETTRDEQYAKVVEEFREVMEESDQDKRIIEELDLIVAAFGLFIKEIELQDRGSDKIRRELIGRYIDEYNEKMKDKKDHINRDILKIIDCPL